MTLVHHKNRTAAELVALVATAWPHIQRFADLHPRPFVAKILADGRVQEVPG